MDKNYCRLCLKQGSCYSPLSVFAEGYDISTKIFLVHGIKILENDSFSKCICHLCFAMLEVMAGIRKKVAMNNSILNGKVKEKFDESKSNNEPLSRSQLDNNQGLMKCSKCVFVTHKPNDLSTHLELHSCSAVRVCPRCSMTFYKEDDLIHHIKLKHKGSSLAIHYSPQLAKLVYSTYKLKKHRQQRKEDLSVASTTKLTTKDVHKSKKKHKRAEVEVGAESSATQRERLVLKFTKATSNYEESRKDTANRLSSEEVSIPETPLDISKTNGSQLNNSQQPLMQDSLTSSFNLDKSQILEGQQTSKQDAPTSSLENSQTLNGRQGLKEDTHTTTSNIIDWRTSQSLKQYPLTSNFNLENSQTLEKVSHARTPNLENPQTLKGQQTLEQYSYTSTSNSQTKNEKIILNPESDITSPAKKSRRLSACFVSIIPLDIDSSVTKDDQKKPVDGVREKSCADMITSAPEVEDCLEEAAKVDRLLECDGTIEVVDEGEPVELLDSDLEIDGELFPGNEVAKLGSKCVNTDIDKLKNDRKRLLSLGPMHLQSPVVLFEDEWEPVCASKRIYIDVDNDDDVLEIDGCRKEQTSDGSCRSPLSLNRLELEDVIEIKEDY